MGTRARVAAVGFPMVLCALLVGVGSPLAAQERVAVTIDYVGAEGVYLAVGAEHGLSAGDTLDVYADSLASTPAGRLALQTVTRRRSVAHVLDPTWAPTRGDVVFVVLPAAGSVPGAAAGGAAVVGAQPARAAGEPVAGGTAGAVQAAGGGDGGPRIDGRIALEVEARETRTSWTGDLSGETRRRFATPTTRLSLTISDLPGGFAVRTNVRASYRYSELASGPPPTSVRAYELAAIKTFDRAPVELRLGRFYNPYESYSTYFDGAMLRVGRPTGLGAGVAAGFEPTRANEGVSSELPKLTGFIDYGVRGRGWRYDTDASIHLLQPDGLDDRLYAGWSQRLGLGPLSLDQRLRVDRLEPSGEWTISQLRVRGTVRVAGPLRLRAAFGRIDTGLLSPFAIGSGPRRDELSGGLALYGRAGSATVDVGRMEWEGDDQGLSVAGSAGLRLGAGLLRVSGRHWQRGEMESLSVAPGLSFPVGALRTNLTYRFYRTDSYYGRLESHAAEANGTFPFARDYQLTARGQYQWGPNLTGTRVQLGIWRRF
jgi:hypothetical protein